MATATLDKTVEATPRTAESRGMTGAGLVHVQGKITAVIYGTKKDSIAVSVDPKQIGRILHTGAGHNTIFDLKVGSNQTKAMIVDWQYEPIKGSLMHIDMKRIAMDVLLRVKVPIHLVGIAEGVKTQGGLMDQVLREVEVECLPTDIPSHIDIDVTEMVFGDVKRVKDLPHGGKLKFVTDEDQTVAHVTAVKEEVVATPEAAAANASAAPAEPDVITKGKQEEEGAAAAPAAPEGKAEKK